VKVYGAISQDIEPPDTWKYSGATVVSGLRSGQRNLNDQKATTVEIGTQAKAGIFDGGLSLYRQWLKNELLTVNVAPGVNVNSNGDHTTHQGIEAALNTKLWEEEKSPNASSDLQPHQLSFRQAYTLNDFFYNEDPTFNNNKLPGLPTHFYQGELLYEHFTGFYAGFNSQVASSYKLDYGNAVSVPSYVIHGFKIGYAQPKKGWETYIDFRNITDQKYAASVSPQYIATTTSAAFQPGDGFGVFGGISYKY
jgi:iron complex outermembrane recepter protein